MRKLTLLLGCILLSFGMQAQITSYPYSENFENGPGGWVASGTNSSWDLTDPNMPVINSAASGDSCWATINGGDPGAGRTNGYFNGENSEVRSPVFDFSSISAPVIRMQVWWNSEFSWDGAVLQSSIDTGQTWQNVGALGDPNNWYNDNTIAGSPGGQPEGWTGRTSSANGSGGWVAAENLLTGLGGQQHVLLRVAFGSDGSIIDDGFAFDDVEIFQLPPASAGAFTIPNPTSDCGLGTDTVCFSYFNKGSAAFDSAMVFYSINGGSPVSALDTTTLNPGDTTTFCFPTLGNFSAPGTYTIRAWVQISGDNIASDDTATVAIDNIPNVSSFPYFENFENGRGGWTSGGTNSSWELGTPANPVINSAASGSNAWITSATGQYNGNEQSFVLSPCFNFSSVLNPRIAFSVWWNSEFSWDGAALQSSIDGGQTWQVVGFFGGTVGDPDNWYNDNTIDGAPGNQFEGWTGRVSSGNGSNGYLLAQHDLVGLGGQQQVNLRVVFGSDGFVQDDGFAFDDVLIFDKPLLDASSIALLGPSSGCGLGLDTVVFAYRNTGVQSFDSAMLSFRVNGGPITTELDTTTLLPGDTAIYTFTGLANLGLPGSYTIEAWVSIPGDNLNFTDSSTLVVTHVPVLNTFPYLEDFESGSGGWTAGGLNPSWQLALPQGAVIDTAASGLKAWVTDSSDFYNNSENSFVVSPCFDFSSLVLPVVRLNVWWESEGGDGAVLQYSLDDGLTWINVGMVGDPNNWFNNNNIFGNPGGQNEGWSGIGTAGSGGWLSAESQLRMLGGAPSVRFRLAFGSSAFGNFADGFAFDDFEIFEQPPVDGKAFAIPSPRTGCSLGLDTICVAYTNNGSVPIDSTVLSYTINGGTVVNETDTTNLAPGDTATYCFTTLGNFSTVGTYNIRAWITVTNDILGLNDTVNTQVENIPVIVSFPYSEDFESSPGGWEAGGTLSSWQWGLPQGAVIDTAASGVKAWMTDTLNNYNNNENSFVISPCFNFATLVRPILKVNIWWDSENSWDGTVLQATTDDGLTWTNIGNLGDINWYNDNSIAGNPGGQQIGWTGGLTNQGSGGWVQGEQVLLSLSRQPSVRLRFAFGSDGSVNGFDGFAFDDIEIMDSPPADAAALDILEPVSGCGLGIDTIRVIYSNVGTQAFDSAALSYSVNGATPVTAIDPRTVSPSDTLLYSFATPFNFSQPGTYNIRFWVVAGGDTINGNDTTLSVVQSVPNVTSYPYIEDFESGRGGWSAGGNGNWQWALPQGTVIDTAASGVKAWVTDSVNNYQNNECSFVLSPCFDFTSLSLPTIRMNVWWDSENSWDGTVLQATTDSGLTWVNIGQFGDPDNWYTDNTITGLSLCGNNGEGWTGGNGSGGWVLAEHLLDSLGGEPDVRLRFLFGSDGSVNGFNGFAFDDIEIRDVPPNDVGVIQILSPSSGDCGDSSTVVSVVVKNFGSADQIGFPVTANIDTGIVALATLNQTYSDTLFPGATDTLILGTFNSFGGGSFDITVFSGLSNDTDRSNDTTFQGGINLLEIPPAPIASDTTLCAPGPVSLSVVIDTNYNYSWYDAPSGGSLLGDSSSLNVMAMGDTTVYVEASSGAGGPCLRITECDLGATDMVEIQNLGANSLDATGWVLAVSDDYTDINDVNTTVWSLGNYAGGAVDFRTDGGTNPFGSNIFWNNGAFPGFSGWAMIVDNQGTVIDAVFFGWTATDIAGFSATINGFSISGANIPWTGDGVDVANLPASSIGLQGSSETNSALDWDLTQTANSQGMQNPSLSIPYACGGGCPSLRTAVNVIIRPLAVDLGPDRAVCEGTVVDGTTPGAASYLWSTMDTTAMLTINQSGQYVLQVTNVDGCVGTDTIDLLVQTLPTVDLGPVDSTACGSVLLDAGNPGAQFSWSTGGINQTQLVTNSGPVTVTVTNTSGCSVRDSINLTILPTPLVDLGADVSVCESATLDAGAFPPSHSYSWNTGATTQLVTVTTTGSYTVTVTDDNGCEGTDDIFVNILPTPNVDLGPDTTACDSIILSAGTFFSYTWNTGAMTQSLNVNTDGTYSVQVLDNNGCIGTDTVSVTLEESPQADWLANWNSATEVQFTNLSTPTGPGVSYLWDFGDNVGTSTAANPTYTYSVAGNYIVSLTVTTTNCGDDVSDDLIRSDIEDELFAQSIVLFPNPSQGLFVLGIEGLDAKQLQVTVTDVVGKVVWEKHEDHRMIGNYEHTIDLNEQADGVYFVNIFDGERRARKKIVKR
jgi:hypothetical protein